MPEEKLVTIVTLSYNKAKYLRDWAEGLAKQTYLDKMKILVFEDGSTDNSLELLKKYQSEYRLPLELINNKKNMGIMYSTLKAYRKIDTKYWAFLDSDDYYISSRKIEKAVSFLEEHEDYSCYACANMLELADGRNVPSPFIQNPSQSFSGIKNSPFFQTASTTFRNCFTPQILEALENLSEDKRDSFNADAFRNFLAHHFGKFYFDSSLDSLWRCNIGAWGTMTPISQDLSNMSAYYEYFKFSLAQWGMDENAQHCLNLSFYFYNKILDEFVKHMKQLDILEFEQAIYKDNDIGQNVFKELIAQVKDFKAFGIKANI